MQLKTITNLIKKQQFILVVEMQTIMCSIIEEEGGNMKKCLIVVDYQNDFVCGALGFEKAYLLEDIIIKKIKEYNTISSDVIFTLDTHKKNYLDTQEGKRLPVVHCLDGSDGHQLFGGLKECLKTNSIVFKKPTFGSLELGNYLKGMEYDEVELVGLVTNMCVLSNAVIAKAALPEARIMVDKNACMSFDEELHSKTLDILKGMHIDVV